MYVCMFIWDRDTEWVFPHGSKGLSPSLPSEPSAVDGQTVSAKVTGTRASSAFTLNVKHSHPASLCHYHSHQLCKQSFSINIYKHTHTHILLTSQNTCILMKCRGARHDPRYASTHKHKCTQTNTHTRRCLTAHS